MNDNGSIFKNRNTPLDSVIFVGNKYLVVPLLEKGATDKLRPQLYN